MQFLRSFISVIIWLVISWLLNFSILGWIVGLIVSFIAYEFILPIIIISAGDNIINKK